MPNWVDNTLTIKGAKNRIGEVRERLEKGLDEGNFLWNIIHPKDEEMEDYKTVIGSGGKAMNDPSGWYMWNISHWGTKWDVSELQIQGRDEEAIYTFNTAWSPPTNAMISLSEQFPEVELTLRFVEEQGWGGEGAYKAGEETVLDEWDIPESHEESIKAQGHCNCDWDNDEEDWFDDCPREEIKK
jgi:hypothetical protein